MITTHPYSLDVIPCKYGVSSQIPTFFCDISICLLLGVGVNIFDRVTTMAYQVTQKLSFFYEKFSNDTSFIEKEDWMMQVQLSGMVTFHNTIMALI